MAVMLVLAGTACQGGDSLESAANKYFAEFPGNRIITWEDLFAKIDAGDDPFILSVRQADVYNEGHIKGAYLAAWGSDLADKVSMLPTDKPVYVYCYSGQTAGQTVALLNVLGVEAYSVKSGYNNGAMSIEGADAYVETQANELSDAKAKFNKDALKFVQDYFNSVADNGNYIVSADVAAPMIAAADYAVMDIRSAADYDAAHIEGAVNVPFGEGMQENFADFEGKKILVACYSGQTAGQTVGILRALGYDAYSLRGGMGGWTSFVTSKAANAYFAPEFVNPMISWEDLFAKMDAGEELNIVSIRSADDYAAGHITGASNAAWGADLADKVSMLPTDAPVYVYCYSGQTAGQATALMRMLGIDAYSVKSGFNKGAMVVEGYEAYVDTEATELSDADANFDAVLLKAVKDYFVAVGMEENANFKIGWDDAQAAVDADEATVIDVRKAEDFAAGHIVNAVNIPFGADMDFSELPSGKLIVACYSGQTAGQTTAVLRMLGHDAVSLHYGMAVGWIAEGYPVVTD